MFIVVNYSIFFIKVRYLFGKVRYIGLDCDKGVFLLVLFDYFNYFGDFWDDF